MNNRDYFDKVAEKWDGMVNHPSDRVAYVLDLLKIARGSSVLDVGSGTGVLLPYLLERVGAKGRLVALDISKSMTELSRDKFGGAGIEFVTEDFLKYQSRDPFDFIVAYSCFPHFLDRGAFFANASTLLKKGGTLMIAHIEGRRSINRVHDGPDGPPSLPLPAVDEVVAQAGRAGFSPASRRDDDEYYVAVLEKP